MRPKHGLTSFQDIRFLHYDADERRRRKMSLASGPKQSMERAARTAMTNVRKFQSDICNSTGQFLVGLVVTVVAILIGKFVWCDSAVIVVTQPDSPPSFHVLSQWRIGDVSRIRPALTTCRHLGQLPYSSLLYYCSAARRPLLSHKLLMHSAKIDLQTPYVFRPLIRHEGCCRGLFVSIYLA